RARTAPADVKPGTLAQTVEDGGGTVVYTGTRGSLNREAVVAADRLGRVQGVSLGSGASVARRAIQRWRGGSLLVVKLPAHAAGRSWPAVSPPGSCCSRSPRWAAGAGSAAVRCSPRSGCRACCS